MKRTHLSSFMTGMVTMLLLVCITGSALATSGKVTKELEYRNISVTLDGEKLDLRDAKGNAVEPFMFEGTNYLPVRALAESLGLSVSWDGANATVVLTSPAEEEATYITRTGSKYPFVFGGNALCSDPTGVSRFVTPLPSSSTRSKLTGFPVPIPTRSFLRGFAAPVLIVFSAWRMG